MVLLPSKALASITAARSEQLPLLSAQPPTPGLASTVSLVVLTVKVASGAATAGATILSATANRPRPSNTAISLVFM